MSLCRPTVSQLGLAMELEQEFNSSLIALHTRMNLISLQSQSADSDAPSSYLTHYSVYANTMCEQLRLADQSMLVFHEI